MRGKGIWAGAGAIGAAILGSSCCWLPLLLLALGAGSAAASVSGFVAAYHWIFVAGSIVILGGAGYFIYFHRSKAECCPTTGKPLRGSRMKTINRRVFPVIALMVLAFTLFPTQVLSIFAANAPVVEAAENEIIVEIVVPGVT